MSIAADRPPHVRVVGAAVLALVGVTLGGCASLVASATQRFADNLGAAVMDQSDPETVRDGAPAYLLLIDSLIHGSPDDPVLRVTAAELYAAYGVLFAGDEERARRLTLQARAHGEQALCSSSTSACGLQERAYDEYLAGLQTLRPGDAQALYAFSLSWLAYIRAHRSDWIALADLPKVQAALERLQQLDPALQAANVHLYLGVLKTLRPKALGGQPEEGRRHFEEAIALSGGRDLSVKVEFARSYARLVYDRELHDRLLNEVLQASVKVPGATLLNTLAQREARELLATADVYF